MAVHRALGGNTLYYRRGGAWVPTVGSDPGAYATPAVVTSQMVQAGSSLWNPTAPGSPGTVGNLQTWTMVLNAAVTVSTVPAGWTLAFDQDVNSDGRRLVVYYRVMTGSDSTGSFSTSSPLTVLLWRAEFTNTDPTTPLDAAVAADTGTGTSVVAPSVTTSTPGARLHTLHAAYFPSADGSGVTLSLPSGMTTGAALATSAYPSRWDFEDRPTTGATGTRTSTASSAGSPWVAASFALRPKPAA